MDCSDVFLNKSLATPSQALNSLTCAENASLDLGQQAVNWCFGCCYSFGETQGHFLCHVNVWVLEFANYTSTQICTGSEHHLTFFCKMSDTLVRDRLQVLCAIDEGCLFEGNWVNPMTLVETGIMESFVRCYFNKPVNPIPAFSLCPEGGIMMTWPSFSVHVSEEDVFACSHQNPLDNETYEYPDDKDKGVFIAEVLAKWQN